MDKNEYSKMAKFKEFWKDIPDSLKRWLYNLKIPLTLGVKE